MATVATAIKPCYHGLYFRREEYVDLEGDGFAYDGIEEVMAVAPRRRRKDDRVGENGLPKLTAILLKILSVLCAREEFAVVLGFEREISENGSSFGCKARLG
ncbi:MAG: hypothetical protein NZM25_00030 [Leptospiraceae bacterium]|nr:hypothetical protein [Leptospiraceae bacterium]MDW8307572.1 hypothetical protein [Leptospiraceae bacterium]